jgi:hypothetical protein
MADVRETEAARLASGQHRLRVRVRSTPEKRTMAKQSDAAADVDSSERSRKLRRNVG